MRFRTRMLLLFLLATIAPLAGTFWLAQKLLTHSLGLSDSRQIEALSSRLEQTSRAIYQRERDRLRSDAEAGRVAPVQPPVNLAPDFALSTDLERFVLSEPDGERLYYLRRENNRIETFVRDLDTPLSAAAREYTAARDLVEDRRALDLSRGFTLTFAVLSLSLWLISMALLWWRTKSITQPVEQLSQALAQVVTQDGPVSIPVPKTGGEVAVAVSSFNRMSSELVANRERLVYLTQVASWQLLARKMAHELKNSLTPIRLTVEEMLARTETRDRAFAAQASAIVVGEVESLENRLRAFSELAAEPPVRITDFDLRQLLEDRITLLKPSLGAAQFHVEGPDRVPFSADMDLIAGIITNLLKNAAEAMGGSGRIDCVLNSDSLSIRDYGPGLPPERRLQPFQPGVSSKRGGSGLGLSIAKRNAILCGCDLVMVPTELGTAFMIHRSNVRDSDPPRF